MTYNELLYESIRFDEGKIAYPIYYLIKNGIVNSNDRYDKAKILTVPQGEVDTLITENPLGMNKIKLYSMPIGNSQHVIIFAENEQAAKGHCMNEMNKIPEKIFDITEKMDMSFWFEDKKKYQSLREVKNETLVFPATVMIYEK